MAFFANPKTREVKEIKQGSPVSDLELFSVRLPAETLEQAQVYAGAANAFEFGLPKTFLQEASQISVPSTITSDDLTPRTPFTPASVSIPEPPTLSFEETPQEKKQVGVEENIQGLLSQLSEKPQFEQLQKEQAGIEAKTQAVESLSRQIRDIAKQQELVPLTIERQSVGRGRTEGGVFPLQMGLRRTLAYDGLIIASRLDAARGDLDIAERKVKTAVDTKFAPLEAKLREQEANYNLIRNSPTTTRQEKQRALDLETKRKKYEEELQTFKETQKTVLQAVNSASAELSKRGAWTDAAKEDLSRAAKSETLFSALDILSPYLKETTKKVLSVAELVAEQKGTAEQIEKVRNARDGAEATRLAVEMGFAVVKPAKEDFAPGVFGTLQRLLGRDPTRTELLNFERDFQAAGRKGETGGLLPSAGFFDPKIESSIREDFVALTGRYKNPIAPTEDEKAQTFKTLRNLYSSQEANDDALRTLIGITPPSEIPPADQTTQQAASSWLGGLFKGGFTAGVKRIFGESEERIRFDELDRRFRRGETLTKSEMEEYTATLKKLKK